VPNAKVIECVIDDRIFLLGLDDLYRDAMKKHERGELLDCAKGVANALNLMPGDAPVEGYYSEEPELTDYFRLVRTLQSTPLEQESRVKALPQFRRLLEVTSSPIFGQPIRARLLPVGRDPLSAALNEASSPEEWTLASLTKAAARIASATDDYSLVGLASRAEDSVVLTALRESVVLYAETVLMGVAPPVSPVFVWKVDEGLCAAAHRFVDTFNALFGRELPPPLPRYAFAFASGGNVAGRCARIGQTNDQPPRYYHWAVAKGVEGQMTTEEFWAPEIWTTKKYRSKHAHI
jgi:hypothetical protein